MLNRLNKSQVRNQFINVADKPVTKRINWETGKVEEVEDTITERQLRLMKKGLLHTNVHHAKSIKIEHIKD